MKSKELFTVGVSRAVLFLLPHPDPTLAGYLFGGFLLWSVVYQFLSFSGWLAPHRFLGSPDGGPAAAEMDRLESTFVFLVSCLFLVQCFFFRLGYLVGLYNPLKADFSRPTAFVRSELARFELVLRGNPSSESVVDGQSLADLVRSLSVRATSIETDLFGSYLRVDPPLGDWIFLTVQVDTFAHFVRSFLLWGGFSSGAFLLVVFFFGRARSRPTSRRLRLFRWVVVGTCLFEAVHTLLVWTALFLFLTRPELAPSSIELSDLHAGWSELAAKLTLVDSDLFERVHQFGTELAGLSRVVDEFDPPSDGFFLLSYLFRAQLFLGGCWLFFVGWIFFQTSPRLDPDL